MNGANGERPTLVGVATGTADGGVAIVRLSGPRARSIAGGLVGALPSPRVLARRALRLGDALEDALVVVMPAPASFTGEDVVELHVHAGEHNVRQVVRACVDGGAAAAGPGDFTRRAFELGRLALDQAEGIAALVGARTEAAVDQARRLVAGELGRQVEAVRTAALDLRAEIEANLDFPDDVEAEDLARWRAATDALAREVAGWVGRFEAGRRMRERARVVIAGPPNAGKSTLFNALLGAPRAIVADQPGTTRDYVEAELALGPYACALVDTAGLGDSGDAIERAGVALARDQLAGADVVVWVEPADCEPVAPPSAGAGAELVRVESKRDRGSRRAEWIGVAIVDGRELGVDRVRAQLRGWFERGADQAWIGLQRHRDRAHEAAQELAAAAHAFERGLELAAFHLGVAEARLGEIVGRSSLGMVGAEVLDRIFARFCIGK